NPNNPDGRLFGRNDLLALAADLRRRGGLLVIDEAFMDVARLGWSLAPDVGGGNVIVLRSFGKFFGLAGLRLGFAIAAPPLGQKSPRGAAPGRSPDRRSRSARKRSPTRFGSSALVCGSTSRRKGSTPCWPIWRCRLSAARACFGWCKRRPPMRCSSIWA